MADILFNMKTFHALPLGVWTELHTNAGIGMENSHGFLTALRLTLSVP